MEKTRKVRKPLAPEQIKEICQTSKEWANQIGEGNLAAEQNSLRALDEEECVPAFSHQQLATDPDELARLIDTEEIAAEKASAGIDRRVWQLYRRTIGELDPKEE